LTKSNSTLITPLNIVFLSLEKSLQDEIILNGGLKLYLDPTYQVEWNATVTGKVAGIPKHPTGDCKEVCDKIKIGDEIAFSYRIVSDRCFPSASDYFVPLFEPLPDRKEFRNQKGDSIKVVAMPPVHGKFNKIWVGLLNTRTGKYLDGCQGNEHDVDNWLSKFKFSGVQTMAFNNLLNVNKQELWRCPFTEILAKRRYDKIIAVNDRVICEPIIEDIKHRIELETATLLPYQDVKMEYIDRAKLISGGTEMGFREGDIVSFDSRYGEKYSLWGNNYLLIKKKRLQGRWN